ncbi:MAG: hypothetical protein HN350_03855, partial [Phycisphaerales bacterium]|nr:hypothetical protein [Phycisphaerales bacterium]
DNDDTRLDGFGESSDWIELQNVSPGAVDLTGWQLQDSRDTWTFPAVSIPGQGRLLIFASDEDQQDPAGYWHTNFKLSKGGEYLALLDDTGEIVHEFAPEYPEQLEDISYGILYEESGTATLIDKGDLASYQVPTGPLDPNWTGAGFNDGAWDSGTTGLGFGLTVPGGSSTLIGKGSVWRYLDNGSDQGTAWRQSDFDDGAWAFGPAELGYGDGGEETVVNSGNPKYITTYFRREFDVSSAWGYSDLTINIQRDDGAVVYLNGQEIVRSNMQSGAINYLTTTGTSAVGGGDETTFYEYHVDPAGLLAEGENVLAVEIHQVSTTSSDISFDLELIGETSTSDLIETDLQGDMLGENASLLVRMPFNVADPLEYSDLTLEMAYEDGYVAYLNGVQVAAVNASGTPAWNSSADSDRPILDASVFAGVSIDPGLLVAGENILAIHAMNDHKADPMFLVCPRLTALAGVTLTENYFTDPTPGDENVPGVLGVVDDTKFSVDRGFFDEAFYVEISTETPDADIRYTLDGSAPSETVGTLYNGPIYVTGTSTLRAIAYRPGYLSTDVDTQTYIFLGDVLTQSAAPENFPTSWRGTAADYEMDPDVVYSSVYEDQLLAAMQSLPSMSIVMNTEDMFGDSGIYSNSGSQGVAWERPTSLEWINEDGSTGFQVNAGIRIYGGAFRGMNLTRKKSFRVFFKDEYGPTKLNFDMFQTEGASTSFDSLILRGGSNDGWNNWGKANTQYIVDEYMRRTQLALGEPGSHGTFVHLYINGLYWGLYNPVERPDASFSAEYFGGEKENWDSIHDGAATGDSNTATWNAMLQQVRAGMSSTAAYEKLQGNNPDGTNNSAYDDMLDVDNFITYMFSNFWGGTGDWPGHNWYAAGQRSPNDSGFKFFNWDSEGAIIVWANLNTNRVGVTNGNPGEIWAALRQNAEFKMRFADHAHRYLFNDGPAGPEASHARYQELADEIELAIIGESARWGDQAVSTPYTQATWASKKDYVLNTYMPQRPAIVLGQLKSAGLYPDVAAPSFNINGAYQHGGAIELGDSLTINASAGSIYYRLDGSDPRPYGGGAPDPADLYTAAAPLNAGQTVKARAYVNGEWSALNEADYHLDLTQDIRVTEIMYNPTVPTAEEIAAGHTITTDFEYVEITNISGENQPLAGLRFTKGIDFTFGDVTIAPGEHVVVVSNQAAFEFRYKNYTGQIAGQYGTGLVDGTQLSDSGEKLQLSSPGGDQILTFDYKDGWYDHADGGGFSLTINNPLGSVERWDTKDGWRPSAAPGGSPGDGDTLATPGSVVVSEVMAHTDGLNDAIELHNRSGDPVDVSGWWLSDQASDASGVEVLTKYQIPAGSIIGAGGYLVLTESAHFGGAFALSEFGDDVYLTSDASGVAGGYREHVDFGASPNGVSLGVYAKSVGGTDFTLMRTPLMGQGNGAAYYEDLLINELMYHPTSPTQDEINAGFTSSSDFEFIEIYNSSPDTTHTLSDIYIGSGVGFSFGWYNADGAGAESWTLEAGATATWDATLPAGKDSYEVFARWDILNGEGGLRDLDGRALYAITHDDGTTTVVRDQQPEELDEGPDYMDEDGWVSLGTYDFDASGQVVLTRGTNNPDNWTIADQVKFVSATHDSGPIDNPTLDSWNTANGPATLAPGQYAVIVSNRAAFDYRYNLPLTVVGQEPAVTVAGQYTGTLSNNGEKVKLMHAGVPEPAPSNYIPYYLIDYVNYGDSSPWPTGPDGSGPSLSRNAPYGPSIPLPYGNDAGSWFTGVMNGTPGQANRHADLTAPTKPQSLVAQVGSPYVQINLNWTPSADSDTYVDHYVVYRNGVQIGVSQSTEFTDTDVARTARYSYAVSAVNRDGSASDRSDVVVASVPGVSSYTTPSSSEIRLVFSQPLVESSAEAMSNYNFSGTLTGATLEADNVTVVLSVAAMNIGQVYSVTIDALDTVSGALIPTGQQISFAYGQAAGANAPHVDNAIADVVVTEDASDTVLDITSVFGDSDAGDTLTLSITGNSNADMVQASLSADALRLSYAADRNGDADITVRATDPTGAWVETTFQVTVQPTDDSPMVATPIADLAVSEDAADTVLDLSGAFYDPDIFDGGDILTLIVLNNSNSGLVSDTFDANELTLSYAGDQHGQSIITVRATDSDGNWVDDTFTVNVASVNDAPVVATPQSDVVVNRNAQPTTLDLDAVFADAGIQTDGDSLTYSITGNTNPTLVTASAAGVLTYAGGQSGTAEITVRATDSGGDWVEDTFTVGVQSNSADVEQVMVRSSGWSDGFLDALDAQGIGSPTLSQMGYRIPDGAGQLDTLPWNNLDTIVIAFSKNVSVVQGDLVLEDAGSSPQAISGFVYDSSTFTATWTLASPIGADRMLIDLSVGAVGSFTFDFNVLPGDADQDETVALADGNGVRDRLFDRSSEAGYSVLHDINGSGRTDFIDWATVRANLGDSLPAAAPAAAPVAPEEPLVVAEPQAVEAPEAYVPMSAEITTVLAPPVDDQPLITTPDTQTPGSVADDLLLLAQQQTDPDAVSLELNLDTELADVLAEAEVEIFAPIN